LEALAHGYGLAEAPVWASPEHELGGKAGALLFSDVLGGGVFRWSPDGEVTTVVPKRRGVGGLALHAEGGLVVTGRTLEHVRGSERRILLAPEGVTGFNDMTTDGAGGVIAGALRFNPFAGEPAVPGEIWRVEGEGKATELLGDIEWPNGIGLSPDSQTIYVSDYARATVFACDLSSSGAANRRVFAKSPAGATDGLAVDEAGDVWVALAQGGGIARFSSDGSLKEILDVPAGFVTSLCFGGTDRRDLFVTTMDNGEDPAHGGAVFRTRVDVAGLPRALATI
jgi:sugar lactone lactonase YvrE